MSLSKIIGKKKPCVFKDKPSCIDELKELAKVLSYEFKDLDSCIEIAEGKSINEIFNKSGELYFRKKEKEYLKSLLLSYIKLISVYGTKINILTLNYSTIYYSTHIICVSIINPPQRTWLES